MAPGRCHAWYHFHCKKKYKLKSLQWVYSIVLKKKQKKKQQVECSTLMSVVHQRQVSTPHWEVESMHVVHPVHQEEVCMEWWWNSAIFYPSIHHENTADASQIRSSICITWIYSDMTFGGRWNIHKNWSKWDAKHRQFTSVERTEICSLMWHI